MLSQELVFKGANDRVLTNSLLVAEKFEKEHRHVLESIRKLVAENSAANSLFLESEYENRGKMYPLFIMSKDGFSLLAMGFTGSKALNFKMDFLNAFNKMEIMLKSDDYILARSQEILQNRLQAVTQQLQILEAEKAHYKEEVKELTPKAKYTDEVLQSTSTFTLTQIAHDLGLRSVHVFTKTLKEKRILHKQSGQWQPTSKFADKGYFDTRTAKYVKSDDTIGTSISTVVTEKGRQYLHNLFTNQN